MVVVWTNIPMMVEEKLLKIILMTYSIQQIRPLEGRGWWSVAENPFQCLTACINLSEALRSPSPETTVSHMPIRQVGSCNGLQQNAAFRRNELGQLQLYFSRRETSRCLLKSCCQVDGKLVKKTVMTFVYGVTYISACDQIKKRIKEHGSIGDDAAMLLPASCYAVRQATLTSLQEPFEAARSIMSWFGNCAKKYALNLRKGIISGIIYVEAPCASILYGTCFDSSTWHHTHAEAAQIYFK
nr:DNA-directed RNA polymerase 1B, mitochondrial-like isoform X4 [Ziziphus jujuba var. spinosa]